MKKVDLKTMEKEIVCLGLGSEMETMVEYWHKNNFKPKIIVFDFLSYKQLLKRYPAIKKWENVSWTSAKPNFTNLQKYETIIRSPGVFLSPELRKKLAKKNLKIISPMQLFLEACPSKKIIGITGTKGKGTSASLLYEIIKKSGKKAWLGGNIGVAPFTFLEKIKEQDYIILELSSFQLEDMTTSPAIAVMTNFYPEHLSPADPNNPNYHVSLKDYWQAKAKMWQNQNKNDILIANVKIKEKIIKTKPKGQVFYTNKSKLVNQLPGEHNKENIALAEEVSKRLKIKKEIYTKAIKNFKGLEHRMEYTGKKYDSLWYNDSFATTPESAITALKSFKQSVILLAGGADKGSDFSQMAKEIKKRKVKQVILFQGKGSDKILKELKKFKYPKEKITVVKSMQEAGRTVKKIVSKENIILLSPGCASFGVFKNYKERGEKFKQLLKKQ